MLERRFNALKESVPPDLWPEIESREPRPPRREIPWGRLGTAAVAFVVAAAGIAFAARAFLGDQPQPREQTEAFAVDPRVTATIQTGDFPEAIAAGFGAVWVTVPTEDPPGDLVKRIDPATNEVVAEIPFEDAGPIAIGHGSVWVVSVRDFPGPQGETTDFDGGVYRIDPHLNEVVAEVPYEKGFVYDITSDQSGIWLAQATGDRSGAVLRIDPTRNEVAASIPVDDAPYSIVSGEGYVWVLLGPRGLVKIDPVTEQVVAVIDANPIAFEMAVGDGDVWVQSWLSAHDPSINAGSEDRPVVIGVDAHSNAVGDPILAGQEFIPITVAKGGVWFFGGHFSGRDQTIARLNTQTMVIDASVALPPSDHESRNFLAYEETTGSIWVANYRGGLTRVDLLSAGSSPAMEQAVAPHIVRTIDVGKATAVEEGFGSVWVTALDGEVGRLLRLDPETGEEVARLALPVPTWEVGGLGLEVGPEAVWVASSRPTVEGGRATVVRIDPATNEMSHVYSLDGSAATDVAVHEGVMWAAVTGDGSARLVGFDLGSGRITTVPLSTPYPREVFVSGGAVWVHEHEQADGAIGDSVLTKYDPATDRVVASITFDDWVSVASSDDAIWAPRGGSLARIDPATATFVGDPIPSPGVFFGGVMQVWHDGIWFMGQSDAGDADISWLNTSTGEVEASVDLGEGVSPIAMDVAPEAVWVLTNEGSLIQIDPPELRRTRAR